uniref:Uncharacterized protein n=1 Tax=Arundo donax TaxID=35708 RepID=A0A0A9B5F2_ARUDO
MPLQIPQYYAIIIRVFGLVPLQFTSYLNHAIGIRILHVLCMY